MSATTSHAPFQLPQSLFSSFSTNNGPLSAVTVPTGGLFPLLDRNHANELAVSTDKTSSLIHHQDIAKEALRLTRETLDSEKNQETSTTTVATDSKTRVNETTQSSSQTTTGVRLNKFVRRLHDMLMQEKDSGIVEWRRGLLVLHSTDAFAKQILPKYFNTRNFKTFRRQLNYYGFVHVRSFSTTGTSTTALWVNQELARTGSQDISSVLLLRRVEPCETAKTTEGRRVRKELAIHTVEEDLGVSAKTLQMDQIRSMMTQPNDGSSSTRSLQVLPPGMPLEIHCPSNNHKRRCSSMDSGLSVPEVVTESSSDEESAANLLLNLSKLGPRHY